MQTNKKPNNKLRSSIIVLKTSRTDYIRTNPNNQREKCQLNISPVQYKMQKGCKFGCFLGKMLCTCQSLPIFPLYYLPTFLVKNLLFLLLSWTRDSVSALSWRQFPLQTSLPSFPAPSPPHLASPWSSPKWVLHKWDISTGKKVVLKNARWTQLQFDYRAPEHLPMPQKKGTQNHKYYYRLTRSQNCCWSTTVLLKHINW